MITFDGSTYFIGDIELTITGKKTAIIKADDMIQVIKGLDRHDLLEKIGRELMDRYHVGPMTVFAIYDSIPMRG